MEVYEEIIQKSQSNLLLLKNININKDNITYCLIKINALSKDLDTIRFYIRDLTTTAANAITTRQTANQTFNNTPTAAAKTS